MSEWTGVLYGLYTNKPINKVFPSLQQKILSEIGYKADHNLYNDEEYLLFYKSKEMLDHHMENGYNEEMDGQGCFCVEAKTVDLFGTASLFEFDGESDFDPYDVSLVFNKIYYYVLVIPQPIDKSSFSKMVHQIFIDVVKNVEQHA